MDKPFRRFDPYAALRRIEARGPAEPPSEGEEKFSKVSDFSGWASSDEKMDTDIRARRKWAEILLDDVERWLSIHPHEFLYSDTVDTRLRVKRAHLDTVLSDYIQTGEVGDRRASVYAANEVAAEAARIARERKGRR